MVRRRFASRISSSAVTEGGRDRPSKQDDEVVDDLARREHPSPVCLQPPARHEIFPLPGDWAHERSDDSGRDEMTAASPYAPAELPRADFLERISTEVHRRVVGQEYMIERLLIGMLTGGHVLMEGLPGLAKTLAVRTYTLTHASVYAPGSGADFPVAFDGQLASGQPYFLVPQPADWMHGTVSHLVRFDRTFIPEENLGVRIEDTFLVRADGTLDCLSCGAPKTADDVEKAMK